MRNRNVPKACVLSSTWTDELMVLLAGHKTEMTDVAWYCWVSDRGKEHL